MVKRVKKRLVLRFPADRVNEPITYVLIKEYEISINILNADITHGKEGNLLIEMRGEATRMGHKSSGISGHIRGWNIGARVECSHEDGKDVVRVYKTSGSSGRARRLIR